MSQDDKPEVDPMKLTDLEAAVFSDADRQAGRAKMELAQAAMQAEHWKAQVAQLAAKAMAAEDFARQKLGEMAGARGIEGPWKLDLSAMRFVLQPPGDPSLS